VLYVHLQVSSKGFTLGCAGEVRELLLFVMGWLFLLLLLVVVLLVLVQLLLMTHASCQLSLFLGKSTLVSSSSPELIQRCLARYFLFHTLSTPESRLGL
jgi:hypothetical protein